MSAGGAWHVPGLTGLRALAALWVLVHHFNAVVGWRPLHVELAGIRVELTPLATCGWVGVDIFFVLSAFLLTRQLLAAYGHGPVDAANRRYYLHRVLRVYPAYLAQIAMLGLVALLAGSPPAWLAWVPMHLAMLQGVSPAGNAAINPVYWTLTVEFWFYGLLPFAVAWLHRGGANRELPRAVSLFVLAIVVSGTWKAALFVLGRDGPVELLDFTFRQLPGGLELFGAGLLAACTMRAIEHGRLTVPRMLPDTLAAAGLGALVALIYVLHFNIDSYWPGGPLLFGWQPLAAAAAALLVAGVSLDGIASRAVFANGPVRYLGEISYSLYLWHFPVALGMANLMPPDRGEGAYLATALVAAVAASALSHRLVERPFLAKRRAWEAWVDARAAAPRA
jgi:peptidoglycan/LPS O-acetylase OafA/YrhL